MYVSSAVSLYAYAGRSRLVFFLVVQITNLITVLIAVTHWRRVGLGKAPDVRDMNPDRKTSLELSVRAYAKKCEGHVINPRIGTEFDSFKEAYEFYNLYSWETGLGI